MGKFLKLWMKANGLTQQEICDELGIIPATISNYMNGKPISTKYLLALSRFTGISCKDLIENHERDEEVDEDKEPWHK